MSRRDYTEVTKSISALCDGETDIITKMATISCELYHALDGFDWVGFYRVSEPGLLKVGPYQGGHGCLVIPFAKGVCGAAARTGEVQLVADAEAFPGHIACSSSTRSEIVLPVWNGQGALLGVLDIDSDKPDAFDDRDATALTQILADAFAKAS